MGLVRKAFQKLDKNMNGEVNKILKNFQKLIKI